jgi:hypothetical protein
MGRCTRMILDDVFEQKDEIAKAVSEELEKVVLLLCIVYFQSLMVESTATVDNSLWFSWLSSM